MSMSVELTLDDYKCITNWFELAFAKTKSQKTQDEITFKKISVMCITKMEEMKDEG